MLLNLFKHLLQTSPVMIGRLASYSHSPVVAFRQFKLNFQCLEAPWRLSSFSSTQDNLVVIPLFATHQISNAVSEQEVAPL